MFKDDTEGQTNYCTHTDDNSICDTCLGVGCQQDKPDIESDTDPQVFHPNLRFKSQYVKDYPVMEHTYSAVIRVDNSPSRNEWINLKIFDKVYGFVINQERIDVMRSQVQKLVYREVQEEVTRRRIRSVNDNKPDMIGASRELQDLYSWINQRIRG